MCNGSKKCESCNSIKIGSTMATKRRKSRRPKQFSVDTTDIVKVGFGAGGSLLLNRGINLLMNNVPEGQTKDILKKAIPGMKLIGAGYLAMDKKQNRTTRMIALGATGAAAVELAVQVVPQYVSIAGTGNLYLDQIASSGDPMLRLTADSSAPYASNSISVSGANVGMMEAELAVQ